MNSPALIKEAYKRAIRGLAENTTQDGLLAASPKDTESRAKLYTSLFSRDIGVSSLGILATENDTLIKGLELSLRNLAKTQSARGQLPFHIRPAENVIQWWMPGTIDSTLWWAIAMLLHRKETGNRTFYDAHKEQIEKAFTWLTYQDTNNDFLLEQGESSDWADEMPRFGIVLYTNALWYWFVRLRVEVEKRTDLAPLLASIHEGINTVLWVHKTGDSTVNYFPDNAYTRTHPYAINMIEYTNTQAVYLPYYLGFLSHKSFEMRCDVYGNILACLSGVAGEEKNSRHC